MKNVVFIGSSSFGQKCLDTLLSLNGSIRVCGAVTAPQTFSISYNKKGVTNVLHADIAGTCQSRGIPVTEITDGMKGDELFETVSAWKPDLFVVCGWYHMVPKRWRDLAPAYGLHASLLPTYSGGAPLVWAIINGEKKTGITLFQFDEGVDSGVIVGQAETPITQEDTIATLYARIEELGLQLVRDNIPRLADGTAVLKTQDETFRSVFPQRSPDDGKIDWDQDAAKIYDFIRAQTKPYPGAFSVTGGKKISIWSSRPCAVDASLSPGEIKVVSNDILVGCHGGTSNDILVGCHGGTALNVLSISVDGKETSIEDAIPMLKTRGAFDA